MEISPAEIIAGLGVMSGVIVMLWTQLNKRWIKVEKALDHCEQQHEETEKVLLRLTGDVGRLQGVEEISKLVIKEVRSLKED